MEYLLEMRGIEKSFPGVKALKGVDLRLRPGTVHALMGENGAGKSTLMKCLFGIYQKDRGQIFVGGKEVHFAGPRDALEGGVAMVHQELNQATKRTVMDNIWLGRYPKRGGFVDEAKMRRDTLTLFREVGITLDPDAVLGTLSVADRQMVEIARAISYRASILVLDEPTSSLTEPEVEHLFRILDSLKKKGCGIIYISHKMAEILAISDDVTVMRDGAFISCDRAEDLTAGEIIHRMVGRELVDLYPEMEGEVGEELLRVSHLSARHARVKDVSFSLHRGEILGFAGLVGAGRTEVLETLFGLRAREEGHLYLDGKELTVRTPRDAIRGGIALLTEERRANGIFGGLSIVENACICSYPRYRGALGLLSGAKMTRDTARLAKELQVKTPSLSTPIRLLSGGNQQKVILGRWMLTSPEVLLLDEPTRGVDVGAKYEIYRLIGELKKQGKGVVVVSSELPELMGICDRIIVMSGGRISGEVSGKESTQEEIMTLAAKFA